MSCRQITVDSPAGTVLDATRTDPHHIRAVSVPLVDNRLDTIASEPDDVHVIQNDIEGTPQPDTAGSRRARGRLDLKAAEETLKLKLQCGVRIDVEGKAGRYPVIDERGLHPGTDEDGALHECVRGSRDVIDLRVDHESTGAGTGWGAAEFPLAYCPGESSRGTSHSGVVG